MNYPFAPYYYIHNFTILFAIIIHIGFFYCYADKTTLLNYDTDSYKL